MATEVLTPSWPILSAPTNGHLDSTSLFEIIDGDYVELPPMSAKAGRLASYLCREIDLFAEATGRGQASTEILYPMLPSARRQRRPDVAFVSVERWALERELPDTDPWPVVPNLAVEVASPTDQAEGLLEKLREYFEAGVELVWVVYPRLQVVHVFQSFTQVSVLTRMDELDGGRVLPGFRLPLTKLFKEHTS